MLSTILAGTAMATGNWTVFQDIDWPHNCKNPYHPGTSASDCADQCFARADCVAVSWNSPASRAHDSACNFKCSTKGQTKLKGELGVLVRPNSKDLCDMPPPPPTPCPPHMPTDWLPRCEGAQLAYSDALSGGLVPEVGNGHIATVVGSDTIYAAGLFNGDAKAALGHTTSRARIPAFNAVLDGSGDGNAPAWTEAGERAMDFERAAFVRRSTLTFASGGCVVGAEQRFFAPHTEPRLLVHEIELWLISGAPSGGASSCDVALRQPVPSPSDDLHLVPMAGATAGKEYAVSGATKVPEDAHLRNVTKVAFAATVLPASVRVSAAATPAKPIVLRHLSVVVTSLNSTDVAADALATLRSFSGAGAATGATLRPAHEAAWAVRADEGHLEVQGDQRLALALNASLYFIRASIRDDWPQGLSPGGLASNGYSGHTVGQLLLYAARHRPRPPFPLTPSSAQRSHADL